MIINQGNLGTLYLGFQTIFNGALGQAATQYGSVAMTVPSGTREEKYGWLGKIPGFRKWLGDRVVQNVMTHDYAIKNEPYENTIAVDRDDIEDDQYGVYNPLFAEMGRTTAAHPDELVWPMLKDGFTGICYDGQPLFDTDHPVLDADGSVTSVANTDAGGGTPWFLMDSKRAVKPVIFQKRRDYMFQAMDRPDDESVFMRKEFRYGVDARVAAGYGLWQTIWGSKQTLDKAHFKTAMAGLEGMKGDYGRPLGLMPDTLVVSPALRENGLEIVNSERDAAGATNVWRGAAKLLVVPWLA